MMTENFDEAADSGLLQPRLVCSLPFAPPFRVISEYRCGTDAHIVDADGNIIIESSQWVRNPERKHKRAMLLICDVLNDQFPANTTAQPRPEQ